MFNIVNDLLIPVGIVAGVAAILALLLAVAHKYLKVEDDERVVRVTEMLPNANCGGCGYPGCSGLAEALVEGKCKKISTCKPSKADAREKIKEYLANTPGPDGKTITVDI